MFNSKSFQHVFMEDFSADVPTLKMSTATTWNAMKQQRNKAEAVQVVDDIFGKILVCFVFGGMQCQQDKFRGKLMDQTNQTFKRTMSLVNDAQSKVAKILHSHLLSSPPKRKDVVGPLHFKHLDNSRLRKFLDGGKEHILPLVVTQYQWQNPSMPPPPCSHPLCFLKLVHSNLALAHILVWPLAWIAPISNLHLSAESAMDDPDTYSLPSPLITVNCHMLSLST